MSNSSIWYTASPSKVKLFTVKGWLSQAEKIITTITGDKLRVVNSRGYPLYGFYELYDAGDYYIIKSAIQPEKFF